MRLAPATRLGPYEILAPLGAGGMGEVYRAKDTRLGREVAVKVLPAEVAADPDRLRRFEQEARAVSALNHPHIVTLHEVGQSEHGPYLVLEKIEGRSLRELLRDGALPLKRALGIGTQVTEGLAKAHAAGIVHRDLKPENVMVTDDGFAKILDFGLAKLVYPELDGGTPHEMTTIVDKTASGMILGTLGYLSPEQAMGRPADFRSDQFALGALLYELATGERPFHRETTPESLAAVIREEPEPLRARNAALPAQLGWIVERCLAKDPNDRYASTRDLARDLADLRDHLSEIARGATSGALEKPRPEGSRERLAWTIAAAAGIAALIQGAISLRLGARVPAATASFRVERLTQLPGVESEPTISPDGKNVVYAHDGHLWLQRVGGSRPTDLTPDSPGDDLAPAFSPDGGSIAFASRRDGADGLFVMGATGENLRRVASRGFRPAWTPDGRELVFSASRARRGYEGALTNGLEAVEIATGTIRKLCDCVAASPAVSPHGRRVAFWGIGSNGSAQRDLWSVPLAGLGAGESPVRLTDDTAHDWDPRWSADGTALEFVSDRGGAPNVWRLPVDESTGRPLGSPFPRTLPATFVAQARAALDGATYVYESDAQSTALLRAEFDAAAGEVRGPPREMARLGEGVWALSTRSFSPDGRRVVLQSGPSGDDIVVVALDGSEVRTLSGDASRNRAPAWSPDGKTVAFASDRSGKYAIWGIGADGGDLRLLLEAPAPLLDPLWSPSGTRLMAFEWLDGGARFQAVVHRLADPPDRVEVVPGPPNGRSCEDQIWSRSREAVLCSDGSGTLWRWWAEDHRVEKLVSTGELRRYALESELSEGRLLLLGGQDGGSGERRFGLLDPVSGATRTLMLVAGAFGVGVQPDERALWINRRIQEADLWTARLEEAAP